MKYKVGDKVKYDSGEWWFYGTVSAIIDNSINTCYRLNVERMEKKDCKFSITQFEFELEADNEVENDKDKRKWENIEVEYLKKSYEIQKKEDLSKAIQTEPVTKPEMKVELKQKNVEMPETPANKILKRIKGRAWERNYESYQRGDKSNLIHTWIAHNRRMYRTGKLQADKYEKLTAINFPFDARIKQLKSLPGKIETPKTPKIETVKPKRGKAWNRKLESYRNGEKSNLISAWVSQNRKEYKNGKLAEDKFEKLMAINFPFDLAKNKDDSWDERLADWKKGEKRSKLVQQWRQRSMKQYAEGKLTTDRVMKLKEIGILK